MSDGIVLRADRALRAAVCTRTMDSLPRLALVLVALVPSCAPPKPPAPPVDTRTPTASSRPADPEASPPKPVAAQTAAFVEPCKPDTPAYDAAYAAYDALDEAMKALSKTADPKPTLAELDRLLAMPCLEHAANHLPYQLADADTGWAVKDWWQRGGSSWVHFYLEIGGPPSTGFDSHHIDVPVGVRPTLTRQSRPSHPLFHLLCEQDDEACHATPAGWRRRAESWFALDAERRLAEQDPRHDSDRCLERAKEHPEPERFMRWYDCMQQSYEKRRMFPLGGMRAAEDGWLVIQGRRGHYSFCDEIRAYDLKTGAFYATQSCSGLALRRNGSVDHQKTDDARKPKQIVGRLPLDAIREAAWMILVADELSDRGVDWHANPAIPDELRVGWPADSGFGGIGLGGFGMSSAQTTLAWKYQRKGKQLTSGTLRWPNDYNHAGKDHAVKLLQIAEEDLVEGCAPARLPAIVMGGSEQAVSGLDATPQSLADAEKALLDALADLRRKAKRCR